MDLKCIDGWKCYMINHIKEENSDKKQSVIFWGIAKGSEALVSSIESKLAESAKDSSYRLIAFEVPDWNDYFSPWEAELSNKQKFCGYGKATLQWIELQSSRYQTYDVEYQKYMIGYSLAGFFSLWCLYQTDCFDGCASCSGSLWYPGWQEYVQQHSISKKSKIYMSLGKKEEKTAHPLMKKVGNLTRWQYHELENTSKVVDSTLVYHNGGHFHKIEERLLDGLLWLLKD